MLAVAASLSSCSKSDSKNIIVDPPAKVAQVFYRTSTDDSETNQLWSVNVDGTNNHQINVTLPSGWGLMDEDMTEVAKDEKTMVVLAYKPGDGGNADLDRYAIFKCNIDGSNAEMVVQSTDNSDFGIQGYINSTSILYWKDANTLYGKELWKVNTDGSGNAKVNITLPAGSFFGDEELAKITSDGKTIVFLVQDALDAESIYKWNIDGSSNPTQVSPADGDVSVSLAIQDLIKDNTVLYRKYRYVAQQDIDELWEVNLDGTDKHQISITLPTGVLLQDEEMAKAFNGGQGLVFSTTTPQTQANNFVGQESIYVSLIDGSHPTLVKALPAGTDIAIQAIVE